VSEPIFQCRGLEKRFRSGDKLVEVLRGVDFEAASGAFLSIQGESGSGKTTFLNLLAGLEAPDAGELWWQGRPVAGASLDELARRRRSLIGMVFQSYCLVPELDAWQNALLGARVAGGGDSAAEAKERARRLLERVGLGERLRHLPATLSGGERQRVAIARALAPSPRAVLADEPTGNLDQRAGDEVVRLLGDLCRETGVTLVLVTHNPAHACLADRRLIMERGQLRPADAPAAPERP